MANNTNLNTAKKRKSDEFYTQYADIEKEMINYIPHFSGRTVYCNCDTPESNFTKYFEDHFEEYGLKRLIATGIDRNTGKGILYDRSGQKGPYIKAIDSGDFRSDECVEYLRQADIVVTNPPFSLFREYMALLFRYNKEFIVIGNQNAITYKEIFPYIKENKLWLGNNYVKEFRQPDGEIKKFGNILWYTNIPHGKRSLPLDFYKTYNDKDFPKYDNYDAIEVSKVCDIPMDYYGVMGVPITFLDKYCPARFEIVGIDRYVEDNPHYGHRFTINNKEVYARILIRRKSPQFEIIGATEENGKGFSNGLFNDEYQIKEPLINGRKKYKRLFIRRTDFPDNGTIYKQNRQ